MRPSWKQFILGVAIGAVAWLLWFRAGGLVLVAFGLFSLSLGLVAHAPFILDDGKYDPRLIRDTGLTWSAPGGAGRWLRELLTTVTVSVALGLAGMWVWERVRLHVGSLTPAVTREQVILLGLGVLWLIVVAASYRKLRRLER